MLDQLTAGMVSAGVTGVVAAAGFVAPGAVARQTPAGVVGNALAGRSVFVADCGGCHTLEAAGSDGEVGPDLDRLSLPEATIIKQVTVGGRALMGRAAARYTIQMIGYRALLTRAQIDDVAAFVYTIEHP